MVGGEGLTSERELVNILMICVSCVVSVSVGREAVSQCGEQPSEALELSSPPPLLPSSPPAQPAAS